VRKDCGPDAVTGLFAHEYGHSLDRAMGNKPNGWAGELTADAWAGCITARAGVPAYGYECFVRSFAMLGNLTHPPGDRRIAAFRMGRDVCEQ
jgi:hypothetical protein